MDGEISSVKLEKTHTIPLPEFKTAEDDHSRRGAAAQSRVERGQVSRARHELTGAPLAPKNATTLEELQSKRPVEQASPIPAVLDFVPESTLLFDKQIFVKCLQTAPSGCAPGPDLLTSAAEDFARATVPDEARKSFMLATMTALQKKDGGVRGIATGSSFRRLVAKTLARQFGKAVEVAPADCVGHAVRTATDRDPQATVLSIDGIGALRSRSQECHVGQTPRGPEPSGFAPIRSCSVP